MLIHEKMLAQMLGVSVALVRKWRRNGRGPKFLRLDGRSVRYHMDDVKSFLSRCPKGGGEK
ncbi:MAG: helix-turn-helix domain-containing protein [Acidobacteria bacterium]|nr:helix-turn-helix domain-containing protein [Acidobacteriota bacterium]